MDLKNQKDYIINQIFPIQEGVGAMVGGLLLLTVLASVTGIAYDKLSKMSKSQLNKIAKQNNVSMSSSNKNIDSKSYKFDKYSKIINENEIKKYISAFNQVMKEVSGAFKKNGCKSNPILNKKIVEYTNAVEYKCSCQILDAKENIQSLEKLADNKGYDIDDEYEHDGEIITCIEDEIIKKLKNFESEMSRVYTHNKYPISIEYHGDDLDDFDVILTMNVVVKK